VEWVSADLLHHLIATYGYVAVAAIIALESMGVPVPGETVLVIASLIASRHHLNIGGVIAAAAAGAMAGDNIGYWVGREFGYRLLLRYGSYLGLTTRRIKLGQYLFMRHGGKVVFFGRFVAVLRVLAAFLAGMNRMDWRTFLYANAAGAVVWSCTVGIAAYTLGRAVLHVTGPLGISLLALAALTLVGGVLFLRRHEAELEDKAEKALPGPLRPPHQRRVRPAGSASRL
jgi:membrane protein DedA with SNARE-associated domain